MYKRASSFRQRAPTGSSLFRAMSMRLGRLGQHAKRKKDEIVEAKKEQIEKSDTQARKSEIRDKGLKAIVRRDFKSLDEYHSALLSNQSLASIHGILVKVPEIPKRPTVKKKQKPGGKRELR